MSLINPKRPRLIKNFAERYLKTRPVANFSTCTGCAACKAACPANAMHLFAAIPPNIELRKKTGEPRNRPEANLSKCIRCYRCREQCPQKALVIHKPLLMKILRL